MSNNLTVQLLKRYIKIALINAATEFNEFNYDLFTII